MDALFSFLLQGWMVCSLMLDFVEIKGKTGLCFRLEDSCPSSL